MLIRLKIKKVVLQERPLCWMVLIKVAHIMFDYFGVSP